MANLPDTIIDERAVKRRNNLFCAAAVAGLIGFGAFAAEAVGLGVLSSLAAGALLGAAINVKTIKHLVVGTGVYM